MIVSGFHRSGHIIMNTVTALSELLTVLLKYLDHHVERSEGMI